MTAAGARLTEAVATGAENDEFGEVFAPRLAHLVEVLADAVACLDATHAHPARLDAYLDELRTAHADTAAAVRELSERHSPGPARQAALLAVVRSMYALDAGTE
ncbi:hypothetical protein C8258_02510 [Nocardia sp. MDA0666]|uniref:hypothetical protein n=1 Tax=Nocardia sp. MDA0666 TaxID=2135448 RepID=UPI000D129645|nr:hypothetical protein [Nocardia sp. MDA0666]PSR69945.1 hypothetical protein C8258_02510 [Nocardia sp. MDA0666]